MKTAVAFIDKIGWLLCTPFLLLGTGFWWMLADRHGHIDWLLYAFGWAVFGVTILLCTKRPSFRVIASQIAVHGKKILPALFAAFLVWALQGDAVVYIEPNWAWGYAQKYEVPDAQVTVPPRPHDCEWETAPLGSKHCHYDSEVQTVRTALATDGVTPLVSYDGGKTWNANTVGVKSSVFVSWSRVEE